MTGYFRTKRALALGLGLFAAVSIGRIEFDRWRHYQPVLATVDRAEVQCWGGGRSDHYVECSRARPQATRRTVLTLSYRSPADAALHQRAIRCDTGIEQTVTYVPGQQVEILAHRDEPLTIAKPRCSPVSSS